MRIFSLKQYVIVCLSVLMLASPHAIAVTTAMLDTGIDPNVLRGVKVPGFDYVNNDPDPGGSVE